MTKKPFNTKGYKKESSMDKKGLGYTYQNAGKTHLVANSSKITLIYRLFWFVL